MALVLTLKFEEVLKIGEALIKISHYKSGQVRISIHAPKEVAVSRTKVVLDLLDSDGLKRLAVVRKNLDSKG